MNSQSLFGQFLLGIKGPSSQRSLGFAEARKENFIMKYLERNVNSIMLELGAKLSADSYKKILYYIYRDFVGLNEIEPLLNDFFI